MKFVGQIAFPITGSCSPLSNSPQFNYWSIGRLLARTLILTSLIAGVTYSGLANASLMYWSVFNVEGESSVGADIVTYNSLNDMLNDTNRVQIGQTSGNGGGFNANIVGAGAFFFNDSSNPVPLPATWPLLVVGLAIMWCVRRFFDSE